MRKTICLLLALCCVLSLSACARSYRISFDKDYDEIISAPKRARAGERVEIRTRRILDGDIHMFADGDRIALVHFDSDYWGYAFTMPDHDVTITLESTDEAGGEEGGAGTETVESVSTADWLPDWPQNSGGVDDYKNVTPDMMSDYVESLVHEGFMLTGGKWAKLMFRDDVWISISDNTEAYGTASVAVTLRLDSGGMSAEEAVSVICEAGMSAPARAAIEITPVGLYEETGLQIFKALFNEPPADNLLDPLFTVKTFVVGGNKAHEISLMDAVWADVDGDGESEAVVLEYGPTSGVCSIILDVFGMQNGKAVRAANSMYILGSNSLRLKTADGKVYLAAGGAEYELTMRGGGVLIDDPGNTLGIMQ